MTGKILIRKTKNISAINEFVLVKNGKYDYILKDEYSDQGLILEVLSTGYTSYERLISPAEIKSSLTFNFLLFKEKIHELDEIVLESKRPYLIKKDTVVYNVESYRDGTEKKVEDLLKNLPGIEVNNENGSIKYKGKLIETVTIEGDNLFDYNYSIGTKNINIDLVEEIEAIENYSENKLLKDIERSDKVSLNLKLKDSKVDFTGSADVSLGDSPDNGKTPVNLDFDLLGVHPPMFRTAFLQF